MKCCLICTGSWKLSRSFCCFGEPCLLCRAFGVPRQGILSVSACCFWRLPSSRISRSRRSRQLGSGKYSPLPVCCTLRLSDGAPPLQIETTTTCGNRRRMRGHPAYGLYRRKLGRVMGPLWYAVAGTCRPSLRFSVQAARNACRRAGLDRCGELSHLPAAPDSAGGLFDRANPATFTAPLSVVSGLLSGILAYQLQRRIMLGQRLWAGLSRLGDYLRHLLADRGCRSDPLRLLQASSREVACHLDGPLRRANPHWRVALRDDSQYLATIDLTVKGKLYAH